MMSFQWHVVGLVIMATIFYATVESLKTIESLKTRSCRADQGSCNNNRMTKPASSNSEAMVVVVVCMLTEMDCFDGS